MRKKRKLPSFPREIYAQQNHDLADGSTYLSTCEREDEVFDNGGDGSDFEPGERVAVYRLVGVVKMTKRVSVTRRKAR